MKKIRKTKNRIGLVGHIVNDITSTKEDETLNVKSIIDYVNSKDRMKSKYVEDLNECYTIGFYNFNPATLNKPYENQYLYGEVMTLVTHGEETHDPIKGGTFVFQIAFTTLDNNVYLRHKVNANDWTKWYKLTGTAV